MYLPPKVETGCGSDHDNAVAGTISWDALYISGTDANAAGGGRKPRLEGAKSRPKENTGGKLGLACADGVPA